MFVYFSYVGSSIRFGKVYFFVGRGGEGRGGHV